VGGGRVFGRNSRFVIVGRFPGRPFIEGPERGWTDGLILACFGLAAVGTAAFIWIERHQQLPLLELRFFRSPPFAGALAIAVLAFVVLAGVPKRSRRLDWSCSQGPRPKGRGGR